MPLKLLELSIVVVAAHHTPSIVTPSFLKENEIVPSEFQIKTGQNIWTEMISHINYKQGFSISVTPDRAIFSEILNPESDQQMQSISIAERFIEILQYVNYRAIGINPAGAVLIEGEPQTAILNQFIRDGKWKTLKESTPKPEVSFTYSYEEKKNKYHYYHRSRKNL